jgi:hypothetical protein
MVKTFHKPLYYQINSLKPIFKVSKKKMLPVFLSYRWPKWIYMTEKNLRLGKLGEKFLV